MWGVLVDNFWCVNETKLNRLLTKNLPLPVMFVSIRVDEIVGISRLVFM